jgi:hypothetical protein
MGAALLKLLLTRKWLTRDQHGRALDAPFWGADEVVSDLWNCLEVSIKD